MISLSLTQTSSVDIHFFSDEIMIKIFSFLGAEDLATCGQICTQWQTLSKDTELYQALAARFHYFNKKNGKTYFQGEKARKRFLAIYRNVRGYNLEEIGKLVPSSQEFKFSLNNENQTIFLNFSYWSCRSAFYAYIHSWTKNEMGIYSSRLFLLACYFGDVKMLKAFNEIENFKPKLCTLLPGVGYAVLGDHPIIVKTIKEMGVDLKNETAILNTSWSEYLLRYAKSEEMKTEIRN